MIKNKKAMLANIIGGFITIMVGVSLMGPIAQELNNLATCQFDNSTLLNYSYSEPNGATDSFGGGGANHFGGYDGTVKHNGFMDTVASTSVIKTNQSLLNPDCVPMTGYAATMLKFVPVFFALAVLAMGLGTAWSALRNVGLFEGGSFSNKSKKKKKEKKKVEI